MGRKPLQEAVERQESVRFCAAEAGLAAHEPTQEEIRQRAHAISLARNGTSSDRAWDWYQAEHELRGRRVLGLT